MQVQLKFVVDSSLAERFKRAVLAKRGKLELSREAEEALRLYLEREAREPAPRRTKDPLLAVIGICASSGPKPNALADKQGLYEA